MNKLGPIIILEDDSADIDIYQTILKALEVENPIEIFSEPAPMMDFLRRKDVNPFLIISDINMPKDNGFTVRAQILEDPELRLKCIPYIFMTTDASAKAVREAYGLSVQGIFRKPSNYNEWKQIIAETLAYWKSCISPNRF